ncbi:MAG: alcohol dehydrogenase catalytic domain-containing protein, partial [Candidatus Binataceae bacterium]
MKAAVFHGPGKPLSIEEIQIDEPREHEVLVRTVASGVCHSDLHFVEGLWPHPTPAVLGHEAAGIVERVGSEVTYLKAGDHVISCPSVFCGRCKQCNSGHPYRCTNRPAVRRAKGDKPRLSKDGVMIRQFSDLSTYAEKMLLHENALVKIRDDMPLDRAALI